MRCILIFDETHFLTIDKLKHMASVQLSGLPLLVPNAHVSVISTHVDVLNRKMDSIIKRKRVHSLLNAEGGTYSTPANFYCF